MVTEDMCNKTLEVGDPLDDESLKVLKAPDDIAAIADWPEDNKDSDVADELQTPGAEVPNKRNH